MHADDEGERIVQSAELAVALVNERKDLLEENKLQLLYTVSSCHTDDYITIARTLVHSERNIAAVVGPGCSGTNMMIGQLVNRKEMALPHLHTSVSPLLKDQRMYQHSFGLLGTTATFVKLLVAIAQQNTWSHVSVIFQYQTEFFHSLLLELQEELMMIGSTAIQTLPVSEEIPLEAMLGSGNRIIIALLDSIMLSRVLCLLHHSHIHFPSYQLLVVTQGPLQSTSIRKFTCSLNQIISSAHDLGAVFLDHQLSQTNGTAPTDVSLTFLEYAHAVPPATNTVGALPDKGSLYYDAVWALSFALNSSMEALEAELGLQLAHYHYGNEDATEIILKEILSLSFEGLSGHIQFYNETRFTARHITLYQIENQSFVAMAAYRDDGLVYSRNIHFIEATFETVTSIQQGPLPLAAFMLLITVLVYVSVTTTHILTVSLRHKKSVKASSPLLTQLAYIACYILGAGAVMLCLQQILPLSPTAHCSLYQAEIWITFTGYTGLFSTLAVKTWRLYRIFVHVWKPGNRCLLSDLTLGAVVLCLLLLTLAMCVLWTVTDPVLPDQDQQVITSEGTPVLLVTVSCTSLSYRVWFGVLLGYNTILLLCTLVLACLTRKIKRQFFNTKFYLYQVIVVLITGIPIYSINMLNPSGKLEFILVSIFLNVTVLVCLVLLFLPPIVPVVKEKLKQHHKQKYLLQFQKDMNKIAEGKFKVLRRQDTFDYRDIRSILLRFPYTSRSRANSMHLLPLKATNSSSIGNSPSLKNSRLSHIDSFVESVPSETRQSSLVTDITVLRVERAESNVFVNLMSLQEFESEEELEMIQFPENGALHKD